MKTFEFSTSYETYKDCYFLTGNFMEDNSLSLEIWNDEYGPIADMTRCLGGACEGYGFLDMNNCPWAAEFVKKLGIGKDTGLSRRNGYCIYPLYEFNMEKVREYERR